MPSRLLVSALLTTALASHVVGAEGPRSRLSGIALGPHGIGFEVRTSLDPTRRINAEDGGTRVAMAVWYPAAPDPAGMAVPRSTTVSSSTETFPMPPNAPASSTRWSMFSSHPRTSASSR